MLLADCYAELRNCARVHERALFPAEPTHSELELQARWFAGDFGRRFQSVAGDQIDIIQFGTWNRAAGPDFSDAVVSINNDRPIRGTIEFDLSDRSHLALSVGDRRIKDRHGARTYRIRPACKW